MDDILLKIENLKAGIEGNQILNGLDLTIGAGETHVLMGPNGAGKSTLGNVIMGNPVYHQTDGKILFGGNDLTGLSADKRARAGLFMSFQNPTEVPGITLESFIRNAIRQRTGKNVKRLSFSRRLHEMMELLDMDESYGERDLNVGFSGGEKKKAEIFQLLMLNPKLAILDETDSGLDVDAMRIVAEGVNKLRTPETSCIVITHYDRLLEMIRPDVVHVLYKGQIVKTAGPELAKEIQERGYDWIKAEVNG